MEIDIILASKEARKQVSKKQNCKEAIWMKNCKYSREKASKQRAEIGGCRQKRKDGVRRARSQVRFESEETAANSATTEAR